MRKLKTEVKETALTILSLIGIIVMVSAITWKIAEVRHNKEVEMVYKVYADDVAFGEDGELQYIEYFTDTNN